MKPNIQKQRVSFFSKGEEASSFSPGDFILVADNSFFSKLVAFGQSIRFSDNTCKKWTHAAIIVTPEGKLIEANGRSVATSDIGKYKGKEYFLVTIDASIEDRQEAINFAISCLNQEYGWMTIFSIAVSLLTGLKFSFGFDGQEICSGLVARSLERTKAIFPRDASHITPCELATYYLTS